MTSLSWTSKRPTVPGWYWYQRNPETEYRVVQVWFSSLCAVPQLMASRLGEVVDVEGRWSGPLEPPHAHDWIDGMSFEGPVTACKGCGAVKEET